MARRQGWMNCRWQSSGSGGSQTPPDFDSGYVLVPCKIFMDTAEVPEAFRIEGEIEWNHNFVVYPEGYENNIQYINTPIYMRCTAQWQPYSGGAFGPHYEAQINMVIPDLVVAHIPRIPATGLNGTKWIIPSNIRLKIDASLPTEWNKYYNQIVWPGFTLGISSPYGVGLDFGIWSPDDEYVNLKTDENSILDISTSSGLFSTDFPKYQFWSIKNANTNKILNMYKKFTINVVKRNTSGTQIDLIFQITPTTESLGTVSISQETFDTFTEPTIFAYRFSTGSGYNPYEKPVI